MTAVLAHLSPVSSGDPADPIERLMWATGGEVLRLPAGDEVGGEYDDLALVSARTRRRLAGARLVGSSHGLWADQLLQVAAGRLPELERMNADEFVSWYVGECLAGLDYRSSVREGARWEDRTEPEQDFGPVMVGTVAAGPVVDVPGAPGWWVAWVLRTVHPPKIDALEALGRWCWSGGDRPQLPDASWVAGLVAKFERRAGVSL